MLLFVEYFHHKYKYKNDVQHSVYEWINKFKNGRKIASGSKKQRNCEFLRSRVERCYVSIRETRHRESRTEC